MTPPTLTASGPSTRFGHKVPESILFSSESPKTSALATLTGLYARRLFTVGLLERSGLRQKIVSLIERARSRERCIDELLQVCTSEGGPDGLGVAIDVLAETGGIVLNYARDYLFRDIKEWHPVAERAYEPNDDYWYILLRAVARTNAPEDEKLRFISLCEGAATVGILEGVVEALGDLGSAAALEGLRNFTESKYDPFIQQLAKERIAEIEG